MRWVLRSWCCFSQQGGITIGILNEKRWWLASHGRDGGAKCGRGQQCVQLAIAQQSFTILRWTLVVITQDVN